MDLARFLNLCAMLFGLFAVLFLSKALFASPEQILRATYHYSAMGWPSAAIISDKAGQKADTLASVILVVIVLGLQVVSLFLKPDISFTATSPSGVLIAMTLVAVVALIVHRIDVGMKEQFELDIKKLAARDRIKGYVETSSCPLHKDVEAISREYFDFKKKTQEDDISFLRRFSAFVGYDVSDNADFSKLR